MTGACLGGQDLHVWKPCVLVEAQQDGQHRGRTALHSRKGHAGSCKSYAFRPNNSHLARSAKAINFDHLTATGKAPGAGAAKCQQLGVHIQSTACTQMPCTYHMPITQVTFTLRSKPLP